MRAFVAGLPAGTKVGIVSFAGEAKIVTLPVADRNAVREALTAVPAPNGQTALGDGLRAALHILAAAGARSIVLITDGRSNTGEDPARVVRDLRAAHVTLYVIGVGESAPAERALQTYVAVTGGSYARIARAAQFRDVLARFAAAAERRREVRDISELPALAGLFLIAAAWLASGWAGRLSFLGEPELHEPLGHFDDAPHL